MTVYYEWVIEELDGPDNPDNDDVGIVDVTHAETYAEALKFAGQHAHARIALVRDRHDAGYSDRSWAYIQGDTLPSHLEDSIGCEVVPVPKRFREQFERAA